MMSQAYRTSAEVDGVWFLEEAQVLELDSKIESHFAALVRMRQSDIAHDKRKETKRLTERGRNKDEIKEELAEFSKKAKQLPPHSEECKTIAIMSGNSEIAICSSFAEAIAGIEILKKNPTGFKVKLRAGKNSSEFSLNEGLFSNSIKIEVKPDSESTAAFLVEIERWAETHRADRFLCWWHRNWLLSAFFAFLFLIIVGPIVDSSKVSYDGIVNAQADARQIIDDGVSESNRDEAIASLLKLAVNTTPTVTRRYSGWWRIAALSAAAMMIVIGSMPPKSILGIGMGKSTLNWRRHWFWFWTRFIPFGFVGAIGLEVALNIISSGITTQLLPGFQW